MTAPGLTAQAVAVCEWGHYQAGVDLWTPAAKGSTYAHQVAAAPRCVFPECEAEVRRVAFVWGPPS